MLCLTFAGVRAGFSADDAKDFLNACQYQCGGRGQVGWGFGWGRVE